MEMKVRSKVPTIAGRIPPSVIPSRGISVKNFQERAFDSPRWNKNHRMTMRMATMARLMTRSSQNHTRSPARRPRVLPVSRTAFRNGSCNVLVAISVGPPVARVHQIGDQVDEERDHEQHDADREQGLVVQPALRRLAELGGDG